MKRYLLDREYPRMLQRFGISTEEVLRKARVAQDTFAREVPSMTASDYFAFMQAVGELAPREDSAILMASAQGIEQFSPPIFASYCARDGRSCIERLARYKRLIGPMEFILREDDSTFSIELSCEQVSDPMPSFLVQIEFVFLVNLIRRATDQQISPFVVMMQQPASYTAFSEFLGCDVEQGTRNQLMFASSDMDKPFISYNEGMWSYFEPELKRRLSELDVDETFSARVRSALIEMLPAGESSIDDVARRLGLSKRTLQRKLSEEGTSFQKQLNHTRELLAKHYLNTTAMSTDEIAYLLGYLELNSFLRAFSAWMSMSPSEYRRANKSV